MKIIKDLFRSGIDSLPMAFLPKENIGKEVNISEILNSVTFDIVANKTKENREIVVSQYFNCIIKSLESSFDVGSRIILANVNIIYGNRNIFEVLNDVPSFIEVKIGNICIGLA